MAQSNSSIAVRDCWLGASSNCTVMMQSSCLKLGYTITVTKLASLRSSLTPPSLGEICQLLAQTGVFRLISDSEAFRPEHVKEHINKHTPPSGFTAGMALVLVGGRVLSDKCNKPHNIYLYWSETGGGMPSTSLVT